MRPGHRDVKRSPDQLQIPRRVQGYIKRRSRNAVLARLASGAGDCLYNFCFQIDLPNQMILSIRDVQRLACEHHALRPKEGSLIERSVLGPMSSSTDGFDQCAVEFR